MNTDTLALVAQFHEAFRRPIPNRPTIQDGLLNNFRVSLIQEELNELEKALADNDLPEVLDALSDIQYVLDGAYLDLGLHGFKMEAFAEVHRSNMAKLGKDGNPIVRADGKILKPANWTPPDLASILNGHA